MLTRQNIIVNQKRLTDYEACKYLCKNKQEFVDSLSPGGVVEFSLLCDSLGLELVQRQVDYYTEDLVGKQSPYFVPPECDGFLSEGEIRVYQHDFDSSFSVDSLSLYFEPVQLELPFK